MSFDARLLDRLLVCTKCRSPLVRDGDSLLCVSSDCRRQFLIRDEIPNMLLEDAVIAPAGEWERAMQRAGRGPTSAAE